MKSTVDLIKKHPWVGWLLFLGTAAIVFLLGIFASTIAERRVETKMSKQMLKPIAEGEARNYIWGENFPRQYERYRSTYESDFASKYGGSAMRDELEADPRMVVLWAGYGFSKDYNQGRGHYRAVEDIRNTLRTGEATPGTCWTCKSTDVVRVMDERGAEAFYADSWMNLGPEIVNPIGCKDCHNPDTMKLQITRPALIEAFERQGKDITEATHQEMRSLVCAQCHVEYYFKGEGKYLTFPWDKGMSVEAMEAYYDEAGFKDWTHALSRAPMIKAQHPGYEVWSTGIHAQRGVSCADCHMPYRTEGGMKFTDHKIQSPLNNIANSCQVCHRESEETLMKNVYDKQDKVKELADRAKDALVKAHVAAKAAWDGGATQAEMDPILQLIRHAQWRWDYSVASHGGSFHNSLEVSRILGTSIDKAQEARIQLTRLLQQKGISEPEMPDLSTKAKAQAYVGLDMEAIEASKEKFLEEVVPAWDAQSNKKAEY